jgi:hypothetical protein
MPIKKAAPQTAAAKKTTAKKAAAKKAAPKKAAVRKAAPKKAAVKKAAVKKAAVKKATPKKAAPRKATPRKAVTAAEPSLVVEAPAPPAPPPPIWTALATVESDTTESRPPGSVVVSFEGPGPQRRLTVAFRFFLAIPQFLWIFVLSVAAFFAVIAGWFAALFTGRLPIGIHNFVSRVVQQSARVSAYSSMLLTDRYPPFALDAPDYAVSVETTPARLNRAAVFFRLILLIPAGIVVRVVNGGLLVVSFVAWLIVLITGRLPAALFEAESAVLRYRVRFNAFASMLTSDYPGGLFGDETDDARATLPPADLPDLPTRPRITRLALSKAARRLVILFIVIGALSNIGSIAVSAVNSSRTTASARELRHAHDELGTQTRKFNVDAQACAVSGGIECVHGAYGRLGDAFAAFGRELDDVDFPLVAIDAAQKLRANTADIVTVTKRLIGVGAGPAFQAAARDLVALLHSWDQHYDDVANLL